MKKCGMRWKKGKEKKERDGNQEEEKIQQK